MKLKQRKLLYAVLGLGAVVASWVALIGLWLSFGRIDRTFLQSAGGLIGVASGLIAIVRLPVSSLAARVVLSLGIATGCAAAISVLVSDMYSSPADFDRDLLQHGWALYVIGCPILVGLALLAGVRQDGGKRRDLT